MWHSSTSGAGDGRLAVDSRKGGRLVVDCTRRRIPRTSHATIAAQPDDPQWVEREIISKRVDGPASKILPRLISGDLQGLGSDEVGLGEVHAGPVAPVT